MVRRLLFLAATLIAAGGQVQVSSQPATAPTAAPLAAGDVLSMLRPGHPRLIFTDEELAIRKGQANTDATLARYVQDVLAQADAVLAKPLLALQPGGRVPTIGGECCKRIYALALAYRWTGRPKYADRARDEMLNVCSWPSWDNGEFLNIAELSHAVAIGYDWLYPALSAAAREAILAGLIRNGLDPGRRAYARQDWWVSTLHNWNLVCNNGLVIAALAVAESEPQRAAEILAGARKSLPKALASYEPDGAWPEGLAYWSYATQYAAAGLAALRTALGTDYGLSNSPGLGRTALFPVYLTGPTGMYFNFADADENLRRYRTPCLFWLAELCGLPLATDAEHEALRKGKADPLDVVWYRAPLAEPPQRLLDKFFDGPVPVAVFRSEWDSPDALWVAVKAGNNQTSHGHLDLGSFELDALGRRWARDLGKDDYGLPGYWDRKSGGRRWSYYRLGSASHNVLMLNGENQAASGRAVAVKCAAGNSAMPYITMDLTGAYPAARRAARGVALVNQRRAVLVQDDLDLSEPVTVTWGMTTDATVSLHGRTAILRQGGRELHATVLSPAAGTFAHESARQDPPQKPNIGVSRLVLRLPAQKGSVSVAILLAPVWPHNGAAAAAQIKPLSGWGADDSDTSVRSETSPAE